MAQPQAIHSQEVQSFVEQSVDPIALYTLVLAVATIGLWIVTWRMLGTTKHTLELARSEFNATHRPRSMSAMSSSQATRTPSTKLSLLIRAIRSLDNSTCLTSALGKQRLSKVTARWSGVWITDCRCGDLTREKTETIHCHSLRSQVARRPWVCLCLNSPFPAYISIRESAQTSTSWDGLST